MIKETSVHNTERIKGYKKEIASLQARIDELIAQLNVLLENSSFCVNFPYEEEAIEALIEKNRSK